MTLGKPHKVSTPNRKRKYALVLSVFVITFVLSFSLVGSTFYSSSSYEARTEQKGDFFSYLRNIFTWWNKPKPIPHPVPVPTPTPTPNPIPNPVPVPNPNPTPTPVPPPTSAPGPIQISNKLEVGIDLAMLNREITDVNKGVYDRPCTEAEHDKTKYHTLVNEEAKCHYDHQHNDDPNLVNNIFGEPGAWFGKPGQSISYPWQTFPAKTTNESNEIYVKTNQMENDTKHEGSAWIVRKDQDCSQGNCVKDFRLQVHMDSSLHAATRFHSYSLEARFCENGDDLSSCGIVRYGGWMDFGRLVTSATPNDTNCANDNQNYIPVAADTQFFPIDRPEVRDEVRCHPYLTILPKQVGSQPLAEWWGHAGGETRIQVRSYNPYGNVDPKNPTSMLTFCKPTDASCDYNGSILTAAMAYTENIPEFTNGVKIDSDENGRTDLKAYFTRFGDINKSCTQPGLDCIPFEYDNVKLNLDYNKDGRSEEARYQTPSCTNCQKVDYDIAPAGKQWITWFYSMAM
ncbi:MAG: hypothetical protein ABIM99_03315 [Candidatus Dojkabacteria bacterium]